MAQGVRQLLPLTGTRGEREADEAVERISVVERHSSSTPRSLTFSVRMLADLSSPVASIQVIRPDTTIG